MQSPHLILLETPILFCQNKLLMVGAMRFDRSSLSAESAASEPIREKLWTCLDIGATCSAPETSAQSDVEMFEMEVR